MAQTNDAETNGRDPLQDLHRGRLTQDEAERLTRAIESDPRLEAEYRLVAALGETDGAHSAFPGELGWARLQQALARETPQRSGVNVWQRSVSVWQAAACLLLAVAGWQLAVAPYLAGRGVAPGYVTATGETGPAPHGPALRVAFVPEASEAAIRTLLRESGATIVDGPTAVGLYTLAFEDEEARKAALDRLVGNPTVIDFVEAQ
ncbi:hypothetical protein [Acuticoccus mangrovi]|uniref:Uncharacterized protein n=1 Tax=Acuticoccus mangrovi TaxID=2796142 RepID=A0A934IP40_9HYPH|nr:hypothetical protein [Acuticoccus mangrovi]MBJ3775470.1 hypothetical protein [Acuticoccus mangrovi]